MRTLPTVGKGKNGDATKSFLLWFYTQYYGYRPDASIYRRQMDRKNPAALIHIFEPLTEDMEPQLPSDAAELIYYLEDAGFNVDGPNIILYPGLLSSYLNRRKNERAKRALDNAVEYLCNGKSNEPEFKAPEGW